MMIALTQPWRRFSRILTEFSANCDAVAAIEFGLLVPMLAMMWIGMIEINGLMGARSKLQSAAMSFADLVGQEQKGSASMITSAEMALLYPAVAAVMDPLPNGKSVLSVRIASVVTRTGKDPIEAWTWSCGTGTVPGTKLSSLGLTPTSDSVITNSSLALSSTKLVSMKNLAEADVGMVVAQMTYAYTPPLTGYFLTSTITMTQEFIVRPRYATRLTLDDPNSADITLLYQTSYTRIKRTCP